MRLGIQREKLTLRTSLASKENALDDKTISTGVISAGLPSARTHEGVDESRQSSRARSRTSTRPVYQVNLNRLGYTGKNTMFASVPMRFQSFSKPL